MAIHYRWCQNQTTSSLPTVLVWSRHYWLDTFLCVSVVKSRWSTQWIIIMGWSDRLHSSCTPLRLVTGWKGLHEKDYFFNSIDLQFPLWYLFEHQFIFQTLVSKVDRSSRPSLSDVAIERSSLQIKSSMYRSQSYFCRSMSRIRSWCWIDRGVEVISLK